MEVFTRIWGEHKKFILLVGSGLALFLILNSCMSGYIAGVEGSKGLLAQCVKMDRDVRDLQRAVSGYWSEKARLETYERQEAALRAEIELPMEEEFQKFDEASPIIQLNQAIDRAWGQALERANLAGVAIPDKLGPTEFQVGTNDGKAEYENVYRYLGVVRRALLALIESGMTDIGRPDLSQFDELPVLPDKGDPVCQFRGVRFAVSGPYEAFLRLLQRVQAPQGFLQVRLVDLRAKGQGDERSVKGVVEFVGIRLAEGAEVASEESRDEKKASGKGAPRRRRTGK